MKISVVTISKNSVSTIERTIESVLEQDHLYEYIIVDGGSTDGTVEILKKYVNDVTIISEPDDGIYEAINKGILRSSGDLIGLINSNDRYLKQTLNVIYKAAILNPGTILHGLCKYVDADHRTQQIIGIGDNFIESHGIPHPTMFVPREIYEKHQFYDVSYRYSSDYDFVLKTKRSGEKFLLIEEILSEFTLGGLSSSNAAIKETIDIQLKYGINPVKNRVKKGLFTLKSWIK